MLNFGHFCGCTPHCCGVQLRSIAAFQVTMREPTQGAFALRETNLLLVELVEELHPFFMFSQHSKWVQALFLHHYCRATFFFRNQFVVDTTEALQQQGQQTPISCFVHTWRTEGFYYGYQNMKLLVIFCLLAFPPLSQARFRKWTGKRDV